MRVLWSLPKAAPALLRHLGAYVELAALDLERAKRDAVGGIIVSLIILVCSLFALLMGCAAVIAVTWDTPHRLAAIAWRVVASSRSRSSPWFTGPRPPPRNLPSWIRCAGNGRKTA